MTFMRKLMDALNMDNWGKTQQEPYPKNSFPVHLPTIDTHSTNEYALFHQIKHFWEKTNCSIIETTYRDTTLNEKSDYALINVLSSFKKSARNPNNFSASALAELGVSNWNNYFKSLLSDGYIQYANIIDILYAQYTTTNLKIIADSIGIKKTGKKYELAERIANSLPQSQIERLISETNFYSISEKGLHILSANEDYILFHKYRNTISLAEFIDNRFINYAHKRNFYDTMFQALSNRLCLYEIHHNYNALQFTHLNIYNLLIEEAKNSDHNPHFDIALNHYVNFLYLSTCFCRYMQWTIKDNIFLNSVDCFILPQLDSHIYKLANYETTINYALIFSTYPPSLLTEDEFKLLIHELLNAPIFDKQSWDKLLQKRMNHFYKFIN